MRKDLTIVSGIMLVMAGIFLLGHLGVDPNILRGATFLIGPLILVFLTRHFRRSAPEVPWACHVAAASGLFWGATTLIGGVGHSVAVASLASRVPEYGPLQVLWFTTGAMLVYTGAMNAVLYRAIKAGRCWAIAIAAATSLLFVAYMLFVNPLPGSGGTLPVMIAIWSLNLLLLGIAGIAAMRWARTRHASGNETATPFFTTAYLEATELTKATKNV